MTPTLLKILLAAAGRSAEQATLFEIVETAAKFASLIEPLLGQAADVDPTPEATSEPARHDGR